MDRAAGSLAAAFSTLLLVAVSGQVTAVKAAAETNDGGDSRALQLDIVQAVNANPKAGWEAKLSKATAVFAPEDYATLLGANFPENGTDHQVEVKSFADSLKDSLPVEFDARTNWPNCTSIGTIREQGHCASCWALSGAEVISDRFCVQLGLNVTLSPNDLLSCCDYCGSCDGGFPNRVWSYFVDFGIVTEECDPYFDGGFCPHPGCTPGKPTPPCVPACKGGSQMWMESKHYGDSGYLLSTDPNNIMAEIYYNGPVQAGFVAYEDFPHYKSGVYRHVTGKLLGKHAVKILGWGTSEAGDDYWLVANSWGTNWGDNGFFKILRGVNECNIEGYVLAGKPRPVS